jgi:hypothetical protein
VNNGFQSFVHQTKVLTSRYFRICLNNKQNLLLNFAIPILTIVIVCSVACGNMFTINPSVDHSINNGYPILTWQAVEQEKEGEFLIHDSGVGKINSKESVYFILNENNDYAINDVNITIKSKDNENLRTYTSDEIKIVEMNTDENNGVYSIYLNTDDLESGNTYTVTLSANTSKQGALKNEITLYVPKELKNISEKVTTAGEGYLTEEKLSSDFDIDEYVMDESNRSTIASIPYSQVVIDGEDYILIDNAETFAYIFSDKKDSSIKWNEKNYYLTCDIDLNGYEDLYQLGKDSSYSGIFDGNAHCISNFKIKSSGLIDNLEGSVKNIGIENATVSTTKENAGVIAGTVDEKGLIYNSYVKDCSVNSDNSSGALAGEISSGSSTAEIYGCYSMDCTIESNNYVAGIVGKSHDGKVRSCYAISELNGNSESAGAITGYLCDNAIVDNCYYLESSGLNLFGVNSDITTATITSSGAVSEDTLKNSAEKIKYDSSSDDVSYYFKNDGQLDEFTDTQTGLFMLVCVAIFVGICNSIQEVCKERNILKREYMTNLNLGAYISSKLIVQALLCAIQMILVMFIFEISVSSKQICSSGVIFGSIWIEYFITMFLLCFASDTLSLLISSVVKTSSTANIFIPIILIVQIVFSGVLFDLGDNVEKFSCLMFSKWGIAGLAISSHLNNGRAQFLLDFPNYELQLGPSMSSVKDAFTSDAGNLLTVWCVLLLFIVIFSVASIVLLKRIKKDKR